MSVESPRGSLGGAFFQGQDTIGKKTEQENLSSALSSHTGKVVKSYFTKMPSSDPNSGPLGKIATGLHRTGWVASTTIKAALLIGIGIPSLLNGLAAALFAHFATKGEGFEGPNEGTWPTTHFLLSVSTLCSKVTAGVGGACLFLAGHGTSLNPFKRFLQCYETTDNAFNSILRLVQMETVYKDSRVENSDPLKEAFKDVGIPPFLVPRTQIN